MNFHIISSQKAHLALWANEWFFKSVFLHHAEDVAVDPLHQRHLVLFILQEAGQDLEALPELDSSRLAEFEEVVARLDGVSQPGIMSKCVLQTNYHNTVGGGLADPVRYQMMDQESALK